MSFSGWVELGLGRMRSQQKDQASSEEASQQRLRESIELSKKLIEQSDRLMQGRRGSVEETRPGGV